MPKPVVGRPRAGAVIHGPRGHQGETSRHQREPQGASSLRSKASFLGLQFRRVLRMHAGDLNIHSVLVPECRGLRSDCRGVHPSRESDRHSAMAAQPFPDTRAERVAKAFRGFAPVPGKPRLYIGREAPPPATRSCPVVPAQAMTRGQLLDLREPGAARLGQLPNRAQIIEDPRHVGLAGHRRTQAHRFESGGRNKPRAGRSPKNRTRSLAVGREQHRPLRRQPCCRRELPAEFLPGLVAPPADGVRQKHTVLRRQAGIAGRGSQRSDERLAFHQQRRSHHGTASFRPACGEDDPGIRRALGHRQEEGAVHLGSPDHPAVRRPKHACNVGEVRQSRGGGWSSRHDQKPVSHWVPACSVQGS